MMYIIGFSRMIYLLQWFTWRDITILVCKIKNSNDNTYFDLEKPTNSFQSLYVFGMSLTSWLILMTWNETKLFIVKTPYGTTWYSFKVKFIQPRRIVGRKLNQKHASMKNLVKLIHILEAQAVEYKQHNHHFSAIKQSRKNSVPIH